MKAKAKRLSVIAVKWALLVPVIVSATVLALAGATMNAITDEFDRL